MFIRLPFRLKLGKKQFYTKVGLDKRTSFKDGVTKFEIPEAKKSTLLESVINTVRFDKAINLHEYVDAKHKELGPIYRDRIGSVNIVFLSSAEGYRKVFLNEGTTPQHFLPEAWYLYNEMRQCQRGLLFMDGEEWLHFRRIFNKLMVSPYTAKDIVTKSSHEAAISLSQEWKSLTNGEYNTLEVEKRLYRWSIEVMMATLLGSSWNYYKENIARDETKRLSKTLVKIFQQSAKLSMFPAKYAMLLRLPVWREFVKVVDETMSIVHNLVIEMNKLGGDGLLHLMKEAGIQDKDLVRIVTDLILAAGDTTAFTTQWVLFLLSTHQKEQDKLAKRVEFLEPEEIVQDSFVKSILKESLRLYPTAPFLTRILPKDCEILGYIVPKGSLILMSLYSSGRDPKNFSKPNEFLPQRWLRNEKENYNGVKNAYASIPFANGVRSCVGKKISETQMALTIAQLVRDFIIECPNASRIKMKLHLISVPSEPILFRLTKREKFI